MAVIKASSVPASAQVFSMADIENAARQILLRARQQAEALLVAAQGEADQLKRDAKAQGAVEGHREGLQRGLEEGRKMGETQALEATRAQLQQALAALTESTTALDQSRAELHAAALQEVVQLAIAIARRVTKRQGIIDPQVLNANLEEAIKLVVQQQDLRIAIAPAQRETLAAALPRLGLKWPALKHVEVVEDASLSPGGCRIFTRQGSIDADLDAQLDRVIDDLLPLPKGAQ